MDTLIKTVYGVFNGQHMMGDDDAMYRVPGNYASKSRLVEGDRMKMAITATGDTIFKQIEPVVRIKVLAKVKIKNNHSYNVVVNDRTYRVLRESINYFRLGEGDNVIVIVPENGESEWAAIDSVVGPIEDDVELTL